MIGAALEAIERSGATLRRPVGSHTDEIDVLASRSQLEHIDRELLHADFRHLEAPGYPDHRFYLALDGDRWLKVDVKLSGTRPRGLTDRVRRRFPLGARRLGPVVALVGPDGAGKGAVIDTLEVRIPVATATVRMGATATTPGRGRASRQRPGSKGLFVREAAFLLVKWLRAWRLIVSAYATAWRGAIVLCDRHPTEVLATRPRRTRWGAWLERVLFGALVPWPDVVVVLDAPADVLLARKGEHTRERLERWRSALRDVYVPRGGVVVSTVGDLEESVAAASQVVWAALRSRRRW